MLHRKPLSSSSGMGLLEVVIASAILVIIALGISNVVVNGQQGAQSVQKHLDSSQLQSFITQTLNTPELCTLSLAGQNPPVAGASVPTLTFATMKFDDSTNSSFNNGQIKIASLKYKGAPTVSGNVYAAIVELQVSLSGAAVGSVVVGGNLAPPVDFPLVATVSSGKISTCGGGQGVAKAWANIYCTVADVCSLQSSFNVSAFSALNGTYTITYQTPLPNANYALLVTTNYQHQNNGSNNVAGGMLSQSTTGAQFFTFARDDGHFNNSILTSVVVIQ